MASITREPNGRKTIQFVASDGRRRSIRLGKVTQRDAEAIKTKVEHLVALQISGCSADGETARWLAAISDSLSGKLARVGLIPRRQFATLDSFLADYISGRSDVKPSTATVYGHTQRNLLDFLGKGQAPREITPGDADRWRVFLVKGLSENTIRRRCGIAKQFFRSAVRQKLIDSNPFTDLRSAVQGNEKREFFIAQEIADRVIEACPDAQWRLLFALSRYGGLRCPSEHLALTWADVDWSEGRMTVRSPKTEHHPGGASREVPLFPELRPYLEEVFELADEGTQFVITRYRSSNTNLRSQLKRILRNAGVEAWPKLFQNLRASRQTELAEAFPIHVVCEWIGNTRAVAMEHYLQVTDDHFDAALRQSTKAVQNPVQQPAAMRRNPGQPAGELTKNNADCTG